MLTGLATITATHPMSHSNTLTNPSSQQANSLSRIMMLIPHKNTLTPTSMHSPTNYSHDTISLALPSTLTLMPNLIPNTLTSSPHMTTLSPIPTHYLVLHIHLRTMLDQQFCYLMLSMPGCHYKSCIIFLHIKQTSAHHSVRACHVIARVNCEAIGSFSFALQRTQSPNPTRTYTYLSHTHNSTRDPKRHTTPTPMLMPKWAHSTRRSDMHAGSHKS